jgi:hypothetical protein
MELATLESYKTLHASASAQTFDIEKKEMYPTNAVIRKTVDGTYDNPTMVMKD